MLCAAVQMVLLIVMTVWVVIGSPLYPARIPREHTPKNATAVRVVLMEIN